MEMEEDNKPPLVDAMVKRKPDRLLGHVVCRKHTHTDLYLHARSHSHPSQKCAVLSTLVQQAKVICDDILHYMLQEKVYSWY